MFHNLFVKLRAKILYKFVPYKFTTFLPGRPLAVFPSGPFLRTSGWQSHPFTNTRQIPICPTLAPLAHGDDGVQFPSVTIASPRRNTVSQKGIKKKKKERKPRIVEIFTDPTVSVSS